MVAEKLVSCSWGVWKIKQILVVAPSKNPSAETRKRTCKTCCCFHVHQVWSEWGSVCFLVALWDPYVWVVFFRSGIQKWCFSWSQSLLAYVVSVNFILLSCQVVIVLSDVTLFCLVRILLLDVFENSVSFCLHFFFQFHGFGRLTFIFTRYNLPSYWLFI